MSVCGPHKIKFSSDNLPIACEQCGQSVPVGGFTTSCPSNQIPQGIYLYFHLIYICLSSAIYFLFRCIFLFYNLYSFCP